MVVHCSQKIDHYFFSVGEGSEHAPHENNNNMHYGDAR